jgi:hypothetical protein
MFVGNQHFTSSLGWHSSGITTPVYLWRKETKIQTNQKTDPQTNKTNKTKDTKTNKKGGIQAKNKIKKKN